MNDAPMTQRTTQSIHTISLFYCAHSVIPGSRAGIGTPEAEYGTPRDRFGHHDAVYAPILTYNVEPLRHVVRHGCVINRHKHETMYLFSHQIKEETEWKLNHTKQD